MSQNENASHTTSAGTKIIEFSSNLKDTLSQSINFSSTIASNAVASTSVTVSNNSLVTSSQPAVVQSMQTNMNTNNREIKQVPTSTVITTTKDKIVKQFYNCETKSSSDKIYVTKKTVVTPNGGKISTFTLTDPRQSQNTRTKIIRLPHVLNIGKTAVNLNNHQILNSGNVNNKISIGNNSGNIYVGNIITASGTPINNPNATLVKVNNNNTIYRKFITNDNIAISPTPHNSAVGVGGNNNLNQVPVGQQQSAQSTKLQQSILHIQTQNNKNLNSVMNAQNMQGKTTIYKKVPVIKNTSSSTPTSSLSIPSQQILLPTSSIKTPSTNSTTIATGTPLMPTIIPATLIPTKMLPPQSTSTQIHVLPPVITSEVPPKKPSVQLSAKVLNLPQSNVPMKLNTVSSSESSSSLSIQSTSMQSNTTVTSVQSLNGDPLRQPIPISITRATTGITSKSTASSSLPTNAMQTTRLTSSVPSSCTMTPTTSLNSLTLALTTTTTTTITTVAATVSTTTATSKSTVQTNNALKSSQNSKNQSTVKQIKQTNDIQIKGKDETKSSVATAKLVQIINVKKLSEKQVSDTKMRQELKHMQELYNEQLACETDNKRIISADPLRHLKTNNSIRILDTPKIQISKSLRNRGIIVPISNVASLTKRGVTVTTTNTTNTTSIANRSQKINLQITGGKISDPDGPIKLLSLSGDNDTANSNGGESDIRSSIRSLLDSQQFIQIANGKLSNPNGPIRLLSTDAPNFNNNATATTVATDQSNVEKSRQVHMTRKIFRQHMKYAMRNVKRSKSVSDILGKEKTRAQQDSLALHQTAPSTPTIGIDIIDLSEDQSDRTTGNNDNNTNNNNNNQIDNNQSSLPQQLPLPTSVSYDTLVCNERIDDSEKSSSVSPIEEDNQLIQQELSKIDLIKAIQNKVKVKAQNKIVNDDRCIMLKELTYKDNLSVSDTIHWNDEIGYLSQCNVRLKLNEFGLIETLSDEEFLNLLNSTKNRKSLAYLETGKLPFVSTTSSAITTTATETTTSTITSANTSAVGGGSGISSLPILPTAVLLTKQQQQTQKSRPSPPDEPLSCDYCKVCNSYTSNFKSAKICSTICLQKYKQMKNMEAIQLFIQSKTSSNSTTSTTGSSTMSITTSTATTAASVESSNKRLSNVLFDRTSIKNTIGNGNNTITMGNSSFQWEEYLQIMNAVAAPVHLFLNPFPSSPNEFAIDMKLEAIDPIHCKLFCVVTVVEKIGYRIKLHFDGYKSIYDFWKTADSMDIFPPGWCNKTGRELQPPLDYVLKKRTEEFDWSTYCHKSKLAPRKLFTHLNSSTTDKNPFKIGMKLEAIDIKVSKDLRVASIADVLDNRVLIEFDGLDDDSKYWTDITSPYLHPINYHREKELPLLLNKDQLAHNTPSFWYTYLKTTKSDQVPSHAFCTRQSIDFKPGMKFEVVDKKVPQLIRPATILDVRDYEIQILFDNWPLTYAYWIDDDSLEIHPVNWSLKTSHPLEPPTGFEVNSLKNACGIVGCRSLTNAKHPELSRHNSATDCPYETRNWCNQQLDTNRLTNINFNSQPETRKRQLSFTTDEEEFLKRIKSEPSDDNNTMNDDIGNDITMGIHNEDDNQYIKELASLTPPQPARPLSQQSLQPQSQQIHDEKSPVLIKTEPNDSVETEEMNQRLSVSQNVLKDYAPNLLQVHKLWQKNSIPIKIFESNGLNRNPMCWSVDDVANYVEDLPNCNDLGNIFRNNEIDGNAFLCIAQDDLTRYLNIKLGPAIKIYNQILQLREEVTVKFMKF